MLWCKAHIYFFVKRGVSILTLFKGVSTTLTGMLGLEKDCMSNTLLLRTYYTDRGEVFLLFAYRCP